MRQTNVVKKLVKRWTSSGSAKIIRDFHVHWYDSYTWHGGVTWEGTPILKNPLDLWMYQEIIYATRPDLIIETGSYRGGSALYIARLLDVIGNGKVVSVDTNAVQAAPTHPRVEFINGSSTSPSMVRKLSDRAANSKRVMVILDSDHSAKHVADELRVLSPLVTPGCYLVVEDTNVNGHPARSAHGPGPMEALVEFLASSQNKFLPDRNCERYYLTFNPSGWLLRVE